MCELLGMNANVPTDICFSFSGLIRRGGLTGPHRDGWGIAFYEGRGYRAFHDPDAGAESQIARLVASYPIKSTNVICHIRKANRGRICLENTHPFARELWGETWSCAHNGQLKAIKKWPLNYYRPVGTTDSEYAFCWLLDQVRKRFPQRPARHLELWRFLEKQIRKLAHLGVCNLLLSDARCLYAFCSTHLSVLTRAAPFGQATLIDADVTVNFSEHTGADDVVTVVATKPLTDNENWTALKKHEFRVFRGGKSITYAGQNS